jgi:multidrug resistance efflux pump
MKLKRWMAIILMTSCAAAVFAWSHAESRARKAVASASRQVVRDEEANLILAGTIGPADTTPIVGRIWNLAVPLNTWVKRGQVVGTEASEATAGEMDSARQELEEARSAEQSAGGEVRQAEEELNAMQMQTSNLDTQEARAKTAEVDAEREFGQRESLLRSGLASQLDYSEAVTVRASAEAAVDSISSHLAEIAVETDELEAKAQAAQADLREATMRRNEAEVVFEQKQGGPKAERVVSPADGIIVASGQPEGTSFGIVSDPRQLCASAMLRAADLKSVRVGQETVIVLDEKPSVTLYAKVSAISEDPGNSPDGALYQVTFVVDNPGGTLLSGAAMHARLVRSSQ